MFEITGTLPIVLLLLVLSYVPVVEDWRIYDRAFLDPLDKNSYKKSCSNGMVAEQDYFLLKGLINTTRYPCFHWCEFGICYTEDLYIKRYVMIPGTTLTLGSRTICSEKDRIKIDTCICTFRDKTYIRLRCNLTAKMIYNRVKIALRYELGVPSYSEFLKLPPIYATSACTSASVNGAARIHPESLHASLGTALLGTAVVCLGSSIVSQF
ncbi:unnamed protein product [Lymnaea stagnalis]|uniref:Uncharacterized protein n=1 Tax=Lymnaea stagnalis TaxID=6523 RepID=A0AAV2H1C4_LYMST